ncbi:MAG TPA: PaaI family thioesterase [Rhizomicrobium sp.]|nr:PaaI family thioesterase [Rhizomicrobium sp.]
MNWATDRLDALKSGTAIPVPVVRTLRLGLLDDWGPGWARKRWQPHDDVLNGDGSLFGGYIAALADQMLAFAAMSVLPDDCGFRTINLQVQFFRVGQAHPLLIESRVVAQSGSLISVICDFRREDETLIAAASAQQMIVPVAKPG